MPYKCVICVETIDKYNFHYCITSIEYTNIDIRDNINDFLFWSYFYEGSAADEKITDANFKHAYMPLTTDGVTKWFLPDRYPNANADD